MKYLKKTSELLLEPKFLPFARQLYVKFIDMEADAVQDVYDAEGSFNLSLKGWLLKCQAKEPTRFFSGFSSTFKAYAVQEVQEIIRNEWLAFESTVESLNAKAIENSIKEFLIEVENIKTKIPNRPFLEPLQDRIIESLDSIKNHYDDYDLSNTSKTHDMNGQAEKSKLKWRGEPSVLCALFLDLRDQKMKRKEDKYLLVGDEDLVRFIEDNFVFLDKNNNTITLANDTIHRYVTGDDMATRILLDFTKLRK
jgi:hypothetical protein